MKRIFATIFISISLITSAVSLAPQPVHAASVSDVCNLSSQEQKKQEGLDLGYCDIINALPNSWIKDPVALINAFIMYTREIVGFLALVGLIVTGIMYITAGSNSDKAAKARNNLGWIISGLILFMLLFWIPTALSSFIGSISGTNLTPIKNEDGIELTTLKAAKELWPDDISKANLDELKQKRAMAVENRVSISINNNVTSPKELSVQEGTLIIWYNFDKKSHRYITDPQKQSTLKIDEVVVAARTYYLQFVDTPGEWHYIDADTPGPITTTGSITVTENTQLTTPSCQTNPQLVNSVAIKVSLAGMSEVNIPIYSGTKITWTNIDDKIHTITGDRRSTMFGPKPTILQPGQSLSYTFTANGNIATSGGQFVYFDETDPATLYSICAFPLQQQGNITNDTL